MKITFLGTGAADWPLEKPAGAMEFRRLSSALIDGVLLIDPGPQVLEAFRTFGIAPGQIRYIINTHRHSDHYCPETVSALKACGAEFVDFSANETKTVGHYRILALQGNHATCRNTVHFMICSGGKTVFYGLDGAWLLYDEVKAIQKYMPDFAVLDATIGDVEGDYRIFEHNNLQMVLQMQKTLHAYIGKVCISHMARTLHADHQTLEKRMQTDDILVAYDGLEVEI